MTAEEGLAYTVALIGAVVYLGLVIIGICAFGTKKPRKDDQEPFDGWPKG
jgi:hypothetical protein